MESRYYGNDCEGLFVSYSLVSWYLVALTAVFPLSVQNVWPDPSKSCGPYKPSPSGVKMTPPTANQDISQENHDTIGMIAIDRMNNVAAGVSTNGLNHKVHG